MTNTLNTPVNSLLNRQSKDKQLTVDFSIQIHLNGAGLKNVIQLQLN
jgi:hypothetical protein